MMHMDARAIRERLHAVTLAIETLETCCAHPGHQKIARTAERALREIALLVTGDEIEEHGATPNGEMRQQRREIRGKTAA